MKHFSFLIIFILLLSCTETPDTGTAESDIKEVLDHYVQAWKAGDIDMIAKLWAHDEDIVAFGTDAAERWVGWKTLKEQYVKIFDVLVDTDIAISSQTITISESGTVAWYSQLMTMSFIAQGQPASVPNIRVSGVLEKRNNRWLLVQRHSSLPVEEKVIEY